MGTSAVCTSIESSTGNCREQSVQFYPEGQESERPIDLSLQGKSNLITRRFLKILVTITGKPEVASLNDEIFVNLNLLYKKLLIIATWFC